MSALPIAVIRRNFLVTLVFGSALCTILLTVPGHAQAVPIKQKETNMIPSNTNQGVATQPVDQTEIRPFHVNIPEEALADLRRRVAATKWPDREQVEDASQGVQLETMKKLAAYWTKEYD